MHFASSSLRDKKKKPANHSAGPLLLAPGPFSALDLPRTAPGKSHRAAPTGQRTGDSAHNLLQCGNACMCVRACCTFFKKTKTNDSALEGHVSPDALSNSSLMRRVSVCDPSPKNRTEVARRCPVAASLSAHATTVCAYTVELRCMKQNRERHCLLHQEVVVLRTSTTICEESPPPPLGPEGEECAKPPPLMPPDAVSPAGLNLQSPICHPRRHQASDLRLASGTAVSETPAALQSMKKKKHAMSSSGHRTSPHMRRRHTVCRAERNPRTTQNTPPSRAPSLSRLPPF